MGFSTKKVASFMIDAVFPRFCVRCGREGSLLCHDCTVDWSPSEPKPEGAHVASFHYADPIVKGLIKAWKFDYDESAWMHLQGVLAPRLGTLRHVARMNNIEAIVPIPLHARRLCERGFDQAVELADFISERLNIPGMRLLERSENTKSQSNQASDAGRINAMQQSPFAFVGSGSSSCVMLVDDVWTTGATARAAARVLHHAGVEKVIVYTIAKGR